MEEKRRKKEEKEKKKELFTQCIEQLERFKTNDSSVITFPSMLNKYQKKELHLKAQCIGFLPKYVGRGNSFRFLFISFFSYITLSQVTNVH